MENVKTWVEEIWGKIPDEERAEFEKKYTKEDFTKGLIAIAKVVQKIIPVIQETAKAMGEFANSLMEACPNKRVLHLAKYGKRRTKKKNINRIKRELRRG